MKSKHQWRSFFIASFNLHLRDSSETHLLQSEQSLREETPGGSARPTLPRSEMQLLETLKGSSNGTDEVL